MVSAIHGRLACKKGFVASEEDQPGLVRELEAEKI